MGVCVVVTCLTMVSTGASTERGVVYKVCNPPVSVSGDLLVYRVSCAKGRKVMRRVFVKAQTAQGPVVRSYGFKCRQIDYGVGCRRGSKQVLSPFPG